MPLFKNVSFVHIFTAGINQCETGIKSESDTKDTFLKTQKSDSVFLRSSLEKCPTCRTEYRPFILGQIPPTPVVTNNRTNPIVQNHYNRCHGKYAGGSKNCTYQPTHQVGALAYCSRCCKIRLRLPRNTTPPNEYLIH